MKTLLALLLFGLMSLPSGVARAQADPFAFLPDGPCQLLLSLKRDDLGQILGANRSKEEWVKFFAEAKLSAKQRETLATYLDVRAPLPERQRPAAGRTVACKDLPKDGRQLVVEQCQSCHNAAYVARATRDAQGWQNLFLARDHDVLRFSPEEQALIISYSAANFPVPDEKIPAAMKEVFTGY